MMEKTVEDEIQVNEAPKIGPGRVLREAREARNLTQEAVAKQLHIDITLVRALEDDDYSKFAAPIFITGHLRAYARLLNLDPESAVEMYHGLGLSSPPPLERVAHLEEQAEPVSRAQAPRWLVYVLLIAVVAVVIVIWRSEVSKLISPVVISPSEEEMMQEGEAGAGTMLDLPPQTNRDAQPSAMLAVPPPAEQKIEQSVPAAATSRENLPRATLELSADNPSWVEIRDKTGTRLFYDLMVPGDRKALEGVPPFDVLLGYAPGIAVQYNGKPVNHTAYTHQDMARFRVGDKGASRD